MARSVPDTVVTLRKAAELAARMVGVAADQRQARRLAARLADLSDVRAAPAGPPPAGAAGRGPRVLVLSPRDWAAHLHWEALLAHGLRLRGADVHVATCGAGLPICDRVNVHEGPPVPCRSCSRYTTGTLQAHGFRPRRLTDLAPAAESDWPELDACTLAELATVTHDGLPLGRLVDVPVKWFLCRSDLDDEPLAAQVTRRFLRAARRLAVATERLLDEVRPDVLLCLNGLFLFEAVAAALAARRGVRVVTYERAHVDGRLFFTTDRPACHYDVADLWPSARDRPLRPVEEARLDRYLADRQHGRGAFAPVWTGPGTAPPPAAGRARVVLFTNVTWDSAALGLDAAYPGMGPWLLDAIDHLAARPGVELVVRAHPSETRLPLWRTRERTTDLIARARPRLPGNIRIVGPEDPTCSYRLVEEAACVLVYTSTIGLEAALAGRPVIVAARPHYAGKGFTLDAGDPGELGALLDAVLADPGRHRPDVVLARRYANLFFFDATAPCPPATEPVGGLARLDVADPARLLPGGDPDFDRCCAGILAGVAHPGAMLDPGSAPHPTVVEAGP